MLLYQPTGMCNRSEYRLGMLEKSWMNVIGSEFEKPYMQQLRTFLRQEKDQKKSHLS